MSTQPIIDAHHHLWLPQSDPENVRYVWLRDIGAPKPFGDPTPIQRDYPVEEFLAEPAPQALAGSVHLQCDPRLPDPVAETAFIQGLSDRTGHPLMIVAFGDLASDQFAETLTRHQAYANMRGVRQIMCHLPKRPDISFAATNLLDDLVWRSNYARLADAGLSFDLQLYPEQMGQAADFFGQHPDTPVIIDHLGSPYDTSDDGLALWEAGMTLLADLPHVSVKLGGYAMYLRGDLGDIARYETQQALTLFGPDRVMFGSNFPVDKLHLTYPQLLAFVDNVLGADAPLRAKVMHDNAARLYRF